MLTVAKARRGSWTSRSSAFYAEQIDSLAVPGPVHELPRLRSFVESGIPVVPEPLEVWPKSAGREGAKPGEKLKALLGARERPTAFIAGNEALSSRDARRPRGEARPDPGGRVVCLARRGPGAGRARSGSAIAFAAEVDICASRPGLSPLNGSFAKRARLPLMGRAAASGEGRHSSPVAAGKGPRNLVVPALDVSLGALHSASSLSFKCASERAQHPCSCAFGVQGTRVVSARPSGRPARSQSAAEAHGIDRS